MAYGEMGLAFKDWASADTGMSAIGVVGGVSAAAMMGDLIAGAFKWEAGTTWDKAGRVGIDAVLSFITFYFGSRHLHGGLKVIATGASIGFLAHLAGMLIEWFIPTGRRAPRRQDINIQTGNVKNPVNPRQGSTILNSVHG